MCIVASATGIRSRAPAGRPRPAGSEPTVIAARYPAGTTSVQGVTTAPSNPAAIASTAAGGAR